MSHWDDSTLGRWVDAEEVEAFDEADRLFFALASTHLRRLDAPPGLADRVGTALPAGAFRATRPLFDVAASLWVRVIAAAAVLVLGVGLALVSPGHILTFGTRALSLAVRAFSGIGAAFAAAAGVWEASLELIGTLGQAAGHLATSGVVPLLIALNLAVACASFAGLKRLLTPREECV